MLVESWSRGILNDLHDREHTCLGYIVSASNGSKTRSNSDGGHEGTGVLLGLLCTVDVLFGAVGAILPLLALGALLLHVFIENLDRFIDLFPQGFVVVHARHH